MPIIGAVIFLGVVLPCVLVLLEAGRANAQSVAALSAGASAYSLMAINLFLAARPRIVDRLAGGLDRLYRVHKYTGIGILPLIVFHKFVGMDLDGQIVATGLAKTSVDIAKIAFPVLLLLLLISWLKRLPKKRRDVLPYQFWRLSHRLIGVVFIALTFHQVFVRVPFDANAMTSKYLLAMGALGILAYAYTQILAPLRRRRYRVTSVQNHKSATVINATPLSKPIRGLRPGAFAIIRFAGKGLGEPHPFTLSKITDDGDLQVSVRALGDFTRKVADRVEPGDLMSVEAPYGSFDFRRGETNQVWLAGGIGITPFLAFADSLGPGDTQNIHLVYSIRSPDEALGLDRLTAASDRCPGFSVSVHSSQNNGRLTATKLAELTAMPMVSAGLWFCGPAPMRKAIVKDLRREGTPPSSVHFEEFEFR